MGKAAHIVLNLLGAVGISGLIYQLFHPPLDTIGVWAISIILVATATRWIVDAVETAID